MNFKESKNIEIKKIVNNKFLKTVSAFANFGGGKIYFGINDDGSILGVENIDEEKLKIENMINDSINPLPKYDLLEIKVKEKIIIKLEVYAGLNTPYYYKGKAYTRFDTSTIVVDDYILKSLLLKGMNLRYEQQSSSKKYLTFNVLEKMFKDKLGVQELSLDVLKSLALYKDDSFNKAAELFADKNEISSIGLDMVRFGDTESVFLDRLTLEKISLLEQYEKALDFFDKWYSPYEEIVGFYRQKRIHIPREAFRESIANILCHRDYMINAKAKIACYKDRIEIVSPGGLPHGITEDEYIEGRISILRNEIIADVLHRLEIIEKFATGVKRIKSEYSEYKQKPIFKVMSNTVTVILPCIVYDEDGGLNDNNGGLNDNNGGLNDNNGGLNDNNGGLKSLFMIIKQNPGIKAKEASKLLENRSIRTIENQIKKLIDLDIIERRGSKKTGGYYVR